MSIQYPYPNRIAGIPWFDVTKSITSGKILWVCSTTGSDMNSGSDMRQPMATIDAAIGKCTASKGDTIYVMPGHAETIAAASGIAADVAGISIIGLGNGTNRPLLTYSATTSTTVISAANVRIANIQFLSAINNLAAFIVVSENNSVIEDCLFYTASTKEAYCFISLTTTYDNHVIRNCEFRQPTDPEGTAAAAGTGAIYVVDSENIVVEGCHFQGSFETAFIHNRTTACKNLWIKNCTGIQELVDGLAVTLVAAASGGMKDTLFTVTAAAAAVENTFWVASDGFFLLNSGFGNDGAGGQLAYPGSAAVS